jgi:hypothetical protein
MSGQIQDPLAHWPQDYRDEIKANEFNACVGHVLLSETDRVRVWSLSLQPGERVGFHRHVLDYFWTVLNDGRALSHYHDGRIVEASYKAGDTKHMSYGKGEFMIHDLHNIGDDVLSFTTVEFLESANAPLPVPDDVRRG